MNIIDECETIKRIIPTAESYTLVNNYGWTWDKDNIHYDLRHVLNVYGAECDLYDLSSRKGDKYLGCKTFSNINEVVNYLEESI